MRLRQRAIKGEGSRQKGLTVAYKFLDMAQARWRKITAAQLVPLVRAGVSLMDGVKIGRPSTPAVLGAQATCQSSVDPQQLTTLPLEAAGTSVAKL